MSKYSSEELLKLMAVQSLILIIGFILNNIL